jgi:hypothetical protein
MSAHIRAARPLIRWSAEELAREYFDCSRCSPARRPRPPPTGMAPPAEAWPRTIFRDKVRRASSSSTRTVVARASGYGSVNGNERDDAAGAALPVFVHGPIRCAERGMGMLRNARRIDVCQFCH